MEIIQGKTARGSLTNCVYVIDDNKDKHCFSYGSEVAAIKNGQYEEYDGDMFYSQTSRKHKKQFQRYFGLI